MVTKPVNYAQRPVLDKCMRGATANLTVTASGDIAKIITHVLMVPIFDGGTKHSQLQADLAFTIKNYLWKTDHKKIWFVTTEVVSVDRVVGQGNDASDQGELNPDSIGAIVRMIEDSCTFPVEIKDWWLSAVRSEIGTRVRNFVLNSIHSIKNGVQIVEINCVAYFMTEESYTGLKYAGERQIPETLNTRDEVTTREQIKARYPKGVVVPLDESSEPHDSYTLTDLPVGNIQFNRQ